MLLIMHVALLVDILQRLPVMWLDRLSIIGGCNSDEHVCRYQSVGWAWAYMCLTLVQGCCSPSDDCTLFDHHHIYTTIGELSSTFDKFLASRSQFDSDHGVDLYVHTCCQSATFARPLFAFYCPLFFTRNKNATALRQINR